MKKRPYIYADNAATTKLAPEALEAMMPFAVDNMYKMFMTSKTAGAILSKLAKKV